MELEEGVSVLTQTIDALRRELLSKPALLDLLPDVQIFHRAVQNALAFDEFFSITNEVPAARDMLRQGLDRASRGDFALLGAASASLLGGGNRPITTQIANTIGLDDISVRGSDSAVTGGASTQVLAFGKRITERLTLVYEQGLTVATNALRIEYALSRTLTLRAEAGVVSSVGLFFRRSFD